MGKKYIGIVGQVISGKSCDSPWTGKCTGSDTVMSKLGTEGDVEVYINSQGGSVFGGFAIKNALDSVVAAGRKVTIYVSPLAASIASYIAAGVKGATVYGAANAKLMFHAPWTGAVGSKEQLRDTADLLDKMEDDLKDAVRNRGVEPQDEWFATGRMKWFSAKEAVKNKLFDGIKDAPTELVTEIHKATSRDNDRFSFFDSAENKDVEKSSQHRMMEIAASMEFTGYLLDLCKDHYRGCGEKPSHINSLTKNSFELIFADGSKSLLNFEQNALNIVAIDWDSTNPQPTTENEMKVKTDGTPVEGAPKTPENVVTTVEEPKAVVPPAVDGEAFVEDETPTNTIVTPAIAPKAIVTETKPIVAETTVVTPHGLTEDQIAFAAENYAKVKAEHVSTITSNPKNAFTAEELNEFSMKTLEKLSALATVDKAIVAGTVDNSLIATISKPKGNGGSLPPPEL